jgi:hypothetical protein
MSGAFGQYETSGSANGGVPDGRYPFVVKSVALQMRNGKPIEGRNGKKRVEIVVEITAGEHAGKPLRRICDVSFGQNSENEKWSTFALFLAAVTGVPCGDPEQKKLGPADLKGRRGFASVMVNEKGYSDIVKFAPAEREDGPRAEDRIADRPERAAASGQSPAREQSQRTPACDSRAQQPRDSGRITGLIGESTRRQIKALADAAHVVDAEMAELVSAVTLGRTRSHLELTEDDFKRSGGLKERLQAAIRGVA